MEIDKLTIGEARQIAALLGNNSTTAHPFQIGKGYFIRTITHHFTGRLIAVYPSELVIEDAAWIADDGRFKDAVAEGKFNEVEPFPDGPVVIGRNSIIDACVIETKLPRSQK